MPEASVSFSIQSSISDAINAAGPGGVVRFTPGTTYLVNGLIANQPDQTWIMRGATLLADGPFALNLQANNLTIIGGTVDGNRVSYPTGQPTIQAAQGSGLRWRDGTLCHSPSWGMLLQDGDLRLYDCLLYDTALSTLLWKCVTPGMTAPQITRCRIDRRTGYGGYAGLCFVSDGAWSYHGRVESCTILMPSTPGGVPGQGLDYANVACEMNWVQFASMNSNNIIGGRIGLSMASCSDSTQQNNRSAGVTNYPHEVSSCEWTVVQNNVGTGVGSLCGVSMSGSSRANRIEGNHFPIGFPHSVIDASTPVPGYPSIVQNNFPS